MHSVWCLSSMELVWVIKDNLQEEAGQHQGEDTLRKAQRNKSESWGEGIPVGEEGLWSSNE